MYEEEKEDEWLGCTLHFLMSVFLICCVILFIVKSLHWLGVLSD